MEIKYKNMLLGGYGIYMLANIFIESEMHNIFGMDIILRIFKYMGILLCVLSCYGIERVKKNKLFYYGMLILFSGLNMLFSGGGTGLLEILIIVLCFTLYKVKSTDVFKCCIYMLLLGHLVVMGLSGIGVLKDDVSSRWVGNYMGSFFAGEYVRHKMGFLASNQIPLTLMIVYIMLIAYKKDKVSLLEHCLILIANVWCFSTFGSRVSFIIIIAIFGLYVGVLFIQKRNIKFKMPPIMWLSVVACAFISIISACLYDVNSRMWRIANEIFYNRLRWSHAAIERYGFSILGYGLNAGIATGENGENIIDNGYILLLMQRGVVIGLLVIVFWCYLLYKTEQKGNNYMVLSIVMIIGASLIDAHLVSYKMIPFYCIPLLEDYMLSSFKRYLKPLKLRLY